MKEEEIRPIAENYVEEYCHCSDGEYTDGSLVCAGIGTALIVSRQLEKRIEELEKEISVLLSCKNCPENKGGLICAKEYENKCLAQKIEFIKELQQENAELKEALKNDKVCKCSHYLNFKDLEKENAELKAQLESERDLPAIAYMQGAEKQKKKDEEELQKWKDEWQEQVQKATDEGYARTLQTIQLTKAKELLKEFVQHYKAKTIYVENMQDLLKQSEQFISEVKK